MLVSAPVCWIMRLVRSMVLSLKNHYALLIRLRHVFYFVCHVSLFYVSRVPWLFVLQHACFFVRCCLSAYIYWVMGCFVILFVFYIGEMFLDWLQRYVVALLCVLSAVVGRCMVMMFVCFHLEGSVVFVFLLLQVIVHRNIVVSGFFLTFVCLRLPAVLVSCVYISSPDMMLFGSFCFHLVVFVLGDSCRCFLRWLLFHCLTFIRSESLSVVDLYLRRLLLLDYLLFLVAFTCTRSLLSFLAV